MSIKSLLAAAVVLSTALPALAQYSVSGTGGIIPASGSGGGGNYTNMLPTSFNTFPLTTPVPAAASNITSVTLTGLTHTWSGDVQAVLWNPTMSTGYNLISRLGTSAAAAAGWGADYGGNYTLLPAGDPLINQTWPAVDPGLTVVVPGGNYEQYYGFPPGWTSGSANVFNTDLASIPVVPGTWTLVVYDGVGGDTGSLTSWTMSGDTGPSTTIYCSGDGSGTACPCGNNGAAGNGCASSVSANGGHLAASGLASIANDSLVLTGTGLPNSSALYFQGTTQTSGGAGGLFGDGLRCASGTVIRLGTKNAVGGTSQYPQAGNPSISVRGVNVAGNMRDYQAWYRNAAAYCTPSTFNLTNGVELTWVP